ncbi:MAG: phosphoglycerate kinase [Desulfohalobiaceae bacterium]|nr:phosphoglycerate kinase [Desulfohalobiaceae bacterium]
MPFIDEVHLEGKTVLLRLDLNVPLQDGVIQDDSRIRAAVPTLEYAIQRADKLVLCSHMGKPKGKRVPELSLQPVAKRIAELLEREVQLAPDCIGDEVRAMIQDLTPGGVLLLENLRFHPGETDNDPEFSRELASLADVYVNDAFGVVHRAHASVTGVVDHMDTACAGFLIQKEWRYLSKALSNPDRPFVLISGGAKVSSKLGLLQNFMDRADRILIGGAMACTFRKAEGYPVGKSLVEEDLIPQAKEILNKAWDKEVSLYLPVDYLMGPNAEQEKTYGVFPFQDIRSDAMILDTGPATHTLFSETLKDAGTIVWNGPMGAFENPTYSQGSVGLIQTVCNVDALTIAGGGDTDSLIHRCGMQNQIDFLSTGGGSFLELLEGKELPGLKALGIRME